LGPLPYSPAMVRMDPKWKIIGWAWNARRRSWSQIPIGGERSHDIKIRIRWNEVSKRAKKLDSEGEKR